MRRNRIKLYNQVVDTYLIEYLMFCKNIEKELQISEKNIVNHDFIKTLIVAVDQIVENNVYPKECIDKLIIVIDFLKEKVDSKLLEEAAIKIKEIHQYSYQIYQSNLCFKINRIQDVKGHSFMAWPKEAIEKSIREDFDNLGTLTFPLEYDSITNMKILDQNYLFTLKKIMFVYPEIFQEPIIQKNALKVLEGNQKILVSKETLLELFNRKNYGFSSIQENEEQLKQLIENFQLENEDLLRKIRNPKKLRNISPFNFYEFNIYKDQIMTEAKICCSQDFVDLSKRKEDTVLLQNIYDLIDYNAENKVYDLSSKQKLYDILNELKENYHGSDKAEFLKKYNEQLVKLNETEGIKSVLLRQLSKLKLSLTEDLKLWEDPELQKDLIESINIDYLILLSYGLEGEDYLNLKKFFLSDIDYIYSIRRFLSEENMLFEDPTIREKTIQVLKEYIELSKKDPILDKQLKKSIKKSLNQLKKQF